MRGGGCLGNSQGGREMGHKKGTFPKIIKLMLGGYVQSPILTPKSIKNNQVGLKDPV